MARASETEVSVTEAVVAHGRTVIGVDGNRYGPGETVELPADEIETLTELGFLVDSNAVVKKQSGPHVSVAAGPTVRVA
jgi:hypothetical protein